MLLRGFVHPPEPRDEWHHSTRHESKAWDDGDQMRLYYMTSRQWGVIDIQTRRLKLGRFDTLNDPFEMHPVNMRDRLVQRVLKEWGRLWGEEHGLLCLTETWQNPVMWAHYAERHYGMCLGFDVQDDLAEEVTYRDKRLEWKLDKHKPQFGLSNDDIRKILLTKFVDWKYERERRILLPLEGSGPDDKGLYFQPFNKQFVLREVLLGDRCTLKAKDIVPLIGKPEQSVSVRKIRSGFGEFRMEYQGLVPEVVVRGLARKE